MPQPTAAYIVFVLRCTAAALLSYTLASTAGLPHPLWACVFALISSLDPVALPLTAIRGRVFGTMIGAAIAITVSLILSRWGVGFSVQNAAAVAICAALVWGRPTISVALWTPAIVLMMATPEESIAAVGVARACEVIVGTLVGWLLHVATEKLGPWTHQPGS